MKIVNLTQHNATQDQKDAGVFDLSDATALRTLLTFNSLPTKDEIKERMAQKFCEGSCEYAKRGSQYIAECEGITGTVAETDFCNGWCTVVSLDGQVLYHQLLINLLNT